MFKKTINILISVGLLALYTQTVNAEWVKTNSPFSIPEIECCVIRDGVVFIGTGMEGIFKSTLNDTSGWSQVCPERLHNTGVKVMAASSKYLFAGVSGEVLKSSDNGISWVRIDSDINTNTHCCMAATDDYLFIGGSGCVWNYRVNDRVWKQVSLGLNVSCVNGMLYWVVLCTLPHPTAAYSDPLIAVRHGRLSILVLTTSLYGHCVWGTTGLSPVPTET